MSANPTKWPNTLKQFAGKLPTNCLSVFGHFVNLALKGLSVCLFAVTRRRNELVGRLVIYFFFCWRLDFFEFLKFFKILFFHKQPSRGVFKKCCSQNIQQIYKRRPMPKCDFNKVSWQLYWNLTSAWVFSCKFDGYFQNSFC